MKYSDRVFELAENHFQDTTKELYTDTLSRIKEEMDFMEHVKDNIEDSLKSLE